MRMAKVAPITGAAAAPSATPAAAPAAAPVAAPSRQRSPRGPGTGEATLGSATAPGGAWHAIFSGDADRKTVTVPGAENGHDPKGLLASHVSGPANDGNSDSSRTSMVCSRGARWAQAATAKAASRHATPARRRTDDFGVMLADFHLMARGPTTGRPLAPRFSATPQSFSISIRPARTYRRPRRLSSATIRLFDLGQNRLRGGCGQRSRPNVSPTALHLRGGNLAHSLLPPRNIRATGAASSRGPESSSCPRAEHAPWRPLPRSRRPSLPAPDGARSVCRKRAQLW